MYLAFLTFFVLFTDEMEDVVNNRLNIIRGMEYDWTTGNLYIIDGTKSAIVAVKTKDTDGQDYRKIIADNLNNPTDIVLHPRSG